MATGSRILWKGAISFGLVHVPISLHTAIADQAIDFDWLDGRSMDPVGYRRINKKTGKDITKEHIVKGVAVEDGHHVVVSDDEIAAAYPQSTRSIDIEAFVAADEIPFVYLDRPYYLAPLGKGAKVYGMLREALLKTQRIGLAKVVIQTRQHLAALVPVGPALVLNLLRWGAEIKTWSDLKLPPEGAKAAGLSESELKMAAQLIVSMSRPFKPEAYRDSFKDDVMALVRRKADSGDTKSVAQPEAPQSSAKTADIIDLTELLKRSLKGSGKSAGRVPAKTVPAKKKRIA